MKMNVLNILDFIVVEDIGKLFDNSVVVVLQCVIGIQVVCINGEVVQVLICGLFDIVIIMNGCNIFIIIGCLLLLIDVFVDLVYLVDVKKLISVFDIEGGIVGSIDI